MPICSSSLKDGGRAPRRRSPRAGAPLAHHRGADRKVLGSRKLYYRRNGKPTGEHITIRAALRPLLHLHGRMLAVEFRPSHLKQVREEMIRLGWSRRYINDSIRRIKTMFAWGTEEELVPAEVTGAVRTVKGLKEGRSEAREKPEVEPVADEVVDATLPHISGRVRRPDPAHAALGDAAGRGPGLAVEEIDRSDPECWEPTRGPQDPAPRQDPVDLPRPQVPGHPHAVDPEGRGRRIFPLTASGFRTAINRACDRAFPHPDAVEGPPPGTDRGAAAELEAWRKAHRWPPNRLRHTAATDIRRRFGPRGQQVILGHAHIKTTEIYAEIDAERGRAVAKAVG